VARIFDKLNLKDQTEILILDAPASFEKEVESLDGLEVQRRLSAVRQVSFALAFVTRKSDVDSVSRSLAAKAHGDAILWFAYPKGSSKTYTCDFNRDSGWDVIKAAGFDSVRQVAIDEDWSALRFRRKQFIRPKS
jgi:hypothetical protein